MNLKPLGNIGTGSVWEEYFFIFIFFFEPLVKAQQLMDGLVSATFFSMNLNPLGTTGTVSVWGEYYLKFFFHF
jgi:hypothetical protein